MREAHTDKERSSMTATSDLVIGVDGGGTKTIAWLALLDDGGSGTVLGRGQAGPGNPRAAGFEVAQANIDMAIDSAFADSQLPRDQVAAACLCLSGAGRAVEQERLTAWANERNLAQVTRVTGDAEPILAAASPENWGIALISGTGSLAWGRGREGQIARSGGWGYLIGDEGSAYAIALVGLRAAVRAADGRGPAIELLARFQQQLDAATPQHLIERVYDPKMTRERIASLAVVVFDAAATDLLAEIIIEAAAVQLADMVAALIGPLSLSIGKYPLGLAGGVLLNQESLRQLVLARLDEKGIAPGTVSLVTEPVRGAVSMARQLGRANELPIVPAVAAIHQGSSADAAGNQG